MKEKELREIVPSLDCMDCGEPNAEMPINTTLPHDQWRRIHDSEGGILCASCIVRRAAKLPRVIACRMRFEFADTPSCGASIETSEREAR